MANTFRVGESTITVHGGKGYMSAPVDFLVNPAQPKLTGGGGLDEVIHKAAGPKLKEACEHIPEVHGVRCPTGEARLTFGANLPQPFVVHTVGPKVSGKTVRKEEKDALEATYHESLKIAYDFSKHLKHPDAQHPKWMDKVHSTKTKEQAFKHKLAAGGKPSIAFCSISTGSYGYPKDKGPKVACNAMVDFAKKHGGMEMHFYGEEKETAAFLKAMKKAVQ